MINTITSYEQHKQLIDKAKSNGCKASNLFMLPQDIENLISLDKWKYCELDCGLLLFEDNNDYYRCYYYLDVEKKYKEIDLNKDVVIEFPFNLELREKQKKQVEKLYELGFELGRQSSEMILVNSPDLIQEISHQVGYADVADVDMILNLLYESFNPLYAFLPSKEELSDCVKNKKVFVIIKDNELAGVLNSDVDVNRAYIKHLVVDNKYRGLGYAKSLIQYFINEYKDVKEFQHWVDINNELAIATYKKFNFEFGIKKANEYIKVL